MGFLFCAPWGVLRCGAVIGHFGSELGWGVVHGGLDAELRVEFQSLSSITILVFKEFVFRTACRIKFVSIHCKRIHPICMTNPEFEHQCTIEFDVTPTSSFGRKKKSQTIPPKRNILNIQNIQPHSKRNIISNPTQKEAHNIQPHSKRN